MDNMSHLSIMLEMYVELSNKIKNIATQHLDAYDMMTFEQRLYTIKFMLRSARRQLEEIGGLGGLDKEVEISLKYGLYQLEFLAAEITVIEPKGSNGTYLKNLAKEVVHDLPWFPDPEGPGERHFLVKEVTKFDMEKEKMDIRRLLLMKDTYNFGRVSVVPILGMAGTGKTSLARLVYHDQDIQQHYFDIKLWVDISGCHYPVDILEGIFRVGEFDKRTFSVDVLASILKEKKLFLVLENLLVEDNGEWFDLLEPLLSMCAKCTVGSKILFTTRSTSLEPHVLLLHEMAEGALYVLKSLDEYNCRILFLNIAFRGVVEECINPHLKDIGLEIFDQCGTNLHVVKIIASMLSFEPTREKWQYINDILFTSIEDPVKSIQSIVDLVQRHNAYAWPLLNYSALFPLDYNFSKLEVHQFIEIQQPIDSVCSEQTLNECFMKLLNMGYFYEDRKRDENGVIICYKVRVLMHEVLKHLVKDEYCLVDKRKKDAVVDVRVIRHVSFIADSSWEAPSWLQHAEQLKSLLFLSTKSCDGYVTIPKLNKILENLKALQALDLAIVDCRSILNSIGQLKHLRYLILGASIEVLPDCITNLHFLQILDLRRSMVRELPISFHKLCHLRHLYTGGRLIDLPPRFDELSELLTLDVFIVGENNGLAALASLDNLAGKLMIRYQEGRQKHTLPVKARILANMNIYDLSLAWSSFTGELVGEKDQNKDDVMQFELLQPPFTLQRLTVQGWKGVKFPRWTTNRFATLLDKLVSIKIGDCSNCQYLPSFRSLRSLESLQLCGLNALEWIEIYDEISEAPPYYPKRSFPSLKYMTLVDLPRLKGWLSTEEQEKHESCQYLPWPFFDNLLQLKLSGCPELMSMPLMPSLHSLEASHINDNLVQHHLSAEVIPGFPLLESLRSLKLTNMSTPEPLPRRYDRLTTLEELSLCWLYNVRVLPESIEHLTRLQRLVVRYLPNLVYLPESIGCISALQHVEIQYCPRLKQIPKSFPQLNNLQYLEIKECIKLERRCQQPGGEDWPRIQHIPNVYLM